jgi:formylglycine-generating enzyme required for sulfatase activity
MSQLFPCPQHDCTHWNTADRKTCWSCKADLSGIDGAALARKFRHKPSKGPLVLVAGMVLLTAVVVFSFLQGRAAANDAEPPVLALDEPSGTEVRTGADELKISGRVTDEHPAIVKAGDEETPVVDGLFELMVPISSIGGDVVVTAYDKAGNASAPVTLSVSVDREEPVIVSMEPADGTVSVTRTLVVSGEAEEELAEVTAQGRPGEVDGTSFRAEVTLDEGGNTVLVTLTDLAGNVSERSVAVTYQERRLPAGFTSTGRSGSGHELFTAAKDGASLVLVPGGAYTRGSAEGDADEKPARELTMSAFFIETTPVTNAQYGKYCEATGAKQPPAPDFQSDYFTAVPDGPVVMVTWTEARAYAEWAGRTLPSEAQWELAARGTASNKWPWGSDGGAAGTHFNGKGDADGYAGTSPVGSFEAGASPYGLHDMAGNVWEWTSDWYSPSYFGKAPAADPQGPGSGKERSLRGGAYSSELKDVRAANRYKRTPNSRRNNVGFRTAAVFPQ